MSWVSILQTAWSLRLAKTMQTLGSDTPAARRSRHRTAGSQVRQSGKDQTLALPAPPTFRFADPAECRSVLGPIGFGEIVCTEDASVWKGPDGQAVLDLIYKGIVRTPMLIDAQPAAAAERIRAAIVKGAEAYRKGVMIELSWPYLLVTATKPSMASV